MNWSNIKEPNKDCPYTHVESDTPLGTLRILWKKYKEILDYSIKLDDTYIDTAYDLDSAKDIAINYLIEIKSKLNDFFMQRLVLDMSDEQKYFVRLKDGEKVFKPNSFNEQSKLECLYWIYMNSDNYLINHK